MSLMTKYRWFALALALAFSLGLWSESAFAQQGQYSLIIGKPFESALPKDFYLEGNAIPTAKRNATMVRTPGGARAIFSLLDTTGYASDIASKYVGMIITEGDISVCGNKLGVGSYGFGWERPSRGAEGPGKLIVYNQAGAKLSECATPRDAALKQPQPLQIVVKQDGTAMLYHGRYSAELK